MADAPLALVTGSAKRLGRALTLALAEQGMNVLVHYRSSKSAAEATARDAAALGVKSATWRADLAVEQEVQDLFTEIRRRFGRLDVLVNNASLLRFQPVMSLSFAQWSEGLAPLHAAFLCCREALPMMHAQGFGRIINITDSSAERIYAAERDTPYRIGKSGILMLTKTFAECGTRFNVTINAIAPGTIEDSQTKPPVNDIPAGRYAMYRDVVQVMNFLINPLSSYVSGAQIKVSGGWDV